MGVERALDDMMLLYLLLFPIAGVIGGCVSPPDGWYSLCDHRDTRICVVSSSFCNTQMDTVLGDTLGIGGSEARPWIILLDPFNQTGASTTGVYLKATGTNDACKLSDSSTPKSKDYVKFYICQILQHYSNSGGSATMANWDWSYALPDASYITFGSVVSDKMKDIYKNTLGIPDNLLPGSSDLQMVHVKLTKQETVLVGSDTPLCRVFEFVGHHVSVREMQIDIRDCQESFHRTGQYDGDDVAIIAFSGENADGSNVTDVEFLAEFDSPIMATQATAVRFQRGDGGVQTAGDVTLKNLSFMGVVNHVVFWNTRGASGPIHMESIDDPSIQNGLSCTIDSLHQVIMKQADTDPPLVYLPSASPSEALNSEDGMANGDAFKKAFEKCWTLVNVTNVLGPASALYKPQKLLATYDRSDVDGSNSRITTIVLAILLSLVAILAIVFIIRDIVVQRRMERYEKKTD